MHVQQAVWKIPFHQVAIKSAPEVFQNCMFDLFADLEGVKVIVDDLLIWGKYDAEHDARLKQVLDRAQIQCKEMPNQARRSSLCWPCPKQRGLEARS